MQFHRRESLFLVVAVVGLAMLWARTARAQFAGPEFQISSYTTDSQWAPSVVADGSGGFIVVWQRLAGFFVATIDLLGQRLDANGSPIGAAFQVNTDTTHSGWGSRLAADGQGHFIVVWHVDDVPGPGKNVLARRSDVISPPTADVFQVNSYTTDSQDRPAIASDGAGNFIVAWTSYAQDGSGYGVFGQRFDGAGAAVGGEFSVSTYSTADQESPAVVADSAGNFVVVWESNGQVGLTPGLVGQRFDSTGAVNGSEFQINTDTQVPRWAPAIAGDGAGNFVVTYSSLDAPSDFGVFGQRYDANAVPQGGEFHVNTYSEGQQVGATVAMDAGGSFVVTWTSYGQDGFNTGVFGQRFSASGEPAGGEFQVNTYTTGDQSGAAVAADASGAFLVTWGSVGQTPSGGDIFGRRLRSLIFANGFFSGEPCAWSVVVGGGVCP